MAGMNNGKAGSANKATEYNSSVLIADTVQTPGGSNDSPSQMTTAVNVATGLTVPVSACLELQSTLGALLLPRLTSAQLAAATFTPSLGMVARDTTLHAFVQSQDAQTITVANNFTPLSIFTASGTLTAAQFIAGYAAPLTLIAGPGANAMILVRIAYFEFIGAVPFAAGGNVGLQWGTTIHLPAGATRATSVIAAATLNGLGATTLEVVTSAGAGSGTVPGTYAGLPISLSNDNAAFTGGGAVKYYIEYSIIPL